jgi:hypothetical protein
MSGTNTGGSDKQASAGTVTVRGAGTRREAGRVTKAVSDGLSAAAVRLSSRQTGPIALAELRVQLPPHAGPEAIAAALERAIVEALEDGQS